MCLKQEERDEVYMEEKDIIESHNFLESYKRLIKKENRSRDDFKRLFEKYPEYHLPYYYDDLFKELFHDRKYTAKLISEFINLDYEYIKDNMVIDNSTLKRINMFHRGGVCDMLITVDDYSILLECNIKKTKELTYKNIHTFNGVNYNMIDKGKCVSDKKAVMLSFDNYDIYNRGELIYKSNIREEEGELESENYDIFHINLDKARNILYNTNDITKLRDIEKLLVFMVNTKKEISKILGGEEYMYEANQNMELKMLDFGGIVERSYQIYDNSLIMKGRKIGLDEGHKLGLDEGHRLGLSEGEKIGIDKGVLQTAKEMLKKNIDINIISECTKLSIDKIKKLKNK